MHLGGFLTCLLKSSSIRYIYESAAHRSQIDPRDCIEILEKNRPPHLSSSLSLSRGATITGRLKDLSEKERVAKRGTKGSKEGGRHGVSELAKAKFRRVSWTLVNKLEFEYPRDV